jgi:hypothetical protein
LDAVHESRWLAALGRGFLSLRPNEVAAKAMRDGLSLLGDLDPEIARDTFCRAYRQYARSGVKAKDLEPLVLVALMNCLDDDVASLNEIKSSVLSYGPWSEKFFAQEARIRMLADPWRLGAFLERCDERHRKSIQSDIFSEILRTSIPLNDLLAVLPTCPNWFIKTAFAYWFDEKRWICNLDLERNDFYITDPENRTIVYFAEIGENHPDVIGEEDQLARELKLDEIATRFNNAWNGWERDKIAPALKQPRNYNPGVTADA